MKKTFSDIFDQGISPLTKIGKYALEFHNHSVIEKNPKENTSNATHPIDAMHVRNSK